MKAESTKETSEPINRIEYQGQMIPVQNLPNALFKRQVRWTIRAFIWEDELLSSVCPELEQAIREGTYK